MGSDGKPRELHVDKALDVTKLEVPTRGTKPLAHIDIIPGAKMDLLAECEYFTVYHGDLMDLCSLTVGRDSFQCVTVLQGNMRVVKAGHELELAKGETVFLPAGLGDYSLVGQAEFILSKL